MKSTDLSCPDVSYCRTRQHTRHSQFEAGLQGTRVGDSLPGSKGEKNVSGVPGKVSGEREGVKGGVGYGPVIGQRKPDSGEREAPGEAMRGQLPQLCLGRSKKEALKM